MKATENQLSGYFAGSDLQAISFQFFINRFSILMFFAMLLYVICKISNFNKWTAKHLAQAFCTELTLKDQTHPHKHSSHHCNEFHEIGKTYILASQLKNPLGTAYHLQRQNLQRYHNWVKAFYEVAFEFWIHKVRF